MAGNFGKYIDRSPYICPAGKVSGDPKKNVASVLNEYTLSEKITALKNDDEQTKKDRFVPPIKEPAIKNPHHCGALTEIRDLMCPKVETRFQTLINDLKSTSQSSYWNKGLGKGRDPTPGLPKGMRPLEVTFGMVMDNKGNTVKQCVNPDKSHYEVLRESMVGHENYKVTHNDYNPGERVNRKYSNAFDPKKNFGAKVGDSKGKGENMKCVMEWYKPEPMISLNNRLVDFKKAHGFQVGEARQPNDYLKTLTNKHTFGKATDRSLYGVGELIRDPGIEICLYKEKVKEWIEAINRMRISSKGRPFQSCYQRLLYVDKDKTGKVSVEDLYKVLRFYHVEYNKNRLDELMKFLGIIKDGMVEYRGFLDIIDHKKPIINIGKIEDIPPNHLYYMTTSQETACNSMMSENSGRKPAGIPSVRTDQVRPLRADGDILANIEDLGYTTHVKTVLEPCIYSQYGLTYRDFFKPRPAETIRSLFEKSGRSLSNENFEKLWKIGVDHDKTGMVCVATFQALLEEFCPLPSFKNADKIC